MENISRTLRILHAADFHLGSPFAALSPQKAAIRQGEQQAAFRAVIDLCRSDRVQLLLLAGDLLDQLRFKGERLRSLIDSFARIPDTTVVISPGNHDPYTQDSPYMTESWPSNVHIFTGEFTHFYFPVLGAAVWGAAFTGLRAIRTLCPPGFSVKDAGKDAGYPEDTLHIVLMHGEIAETAQEKHSYNPVLREWIARSGADYAALGHVHDRSDLCRAGNTCFAYPGCPESRGFDEPGPRGVYIGMLSKGKAELDFWPVNQRSYFCPDISVDGSATQQELEDRIISFLQTEYGDDYTKCAFRIALKGALPADFTPNLSSLRERLAAIVFAVRVKDQTIAFSDPEELRRETSLRGVFADILLSRLEEARTAGDPDTELACQQALTLGLRAFTGEVLYSEDQ